MMQGQSTGKRLALLVIIIVGLLGALLLLGWIAFWLIAFAALALFFLLIAPFVFLLPALRRGRPAGLHHVGQAPLGRPDRQAALRDRARGRHLRRGGDRRDGQPGRARLARRLGRRSHLLVDGLPEASRAREPPHLQRGSGRRGRPRRAATGSPACTTRPGSRRRRCAPSIVRSCVRSGGRPRARA